ncbi:probable cytochrome P450 305a1 [Folsomia candida]|nr:probable cytochrome P450 305a1 [Folsomia candida]
MWQMVEGRIKPGDEDDIKMLVVKSDAFIRSRSRGSGIVNSFPFLRFVFPQTLGYNDQMAFFNSCNKVAGKLYLDAESRLKENPTSTPTNLVESFVKNFSNDAKIFCRENFQIVFQDLLIGSTDTSSSFMECVILYLISYPEVQQKIYEEIVAIQGGPGENKFITFLDRKSMPYTQAFLLELHRNAKILQNSVPRRALWDFKYKNYVIKKDTVILTDMRLYYEDKSIWQDPETFRPERFLTSNREICNAANIISFSVGKRNCPGELYANLVTFLLTTIIVGRYKLSVPVGQEKPRLDLRPGFAFKPYPFQATFTKR